MMKKFEVGERVVLVKESNLETYDPECDDTTRGIVKSVDDPNMPLVRWDNSWKNPRTEKVKADGLITEVEAEAIISKLEQEYEAVAGPIREKISASAKLLTEAGQLAKKQNMNLSEVNELVSPLISAMRGIGWRTSALNC